MIFHVLSIPVHPTSKVITICAFTQKVYKFCSEMFRRGHTVYHYGHPDSSVPCTEHINVISRSTYEDHYKGQKWQDVLHPNIQNKLHEEFNVNAARDALNRRHDKIDLVLAFWGVGH